jgi:hypothetical protein
MENPEGQGFRCPFGKDDEELEELDEIVEEDLAIYRFGPRLDVSKKLRLGECSFIREGSSGGGRGETIVGDCIGAVHNCLIFGFGGSRSGEKINLR